MISHKNATTIEWLLKVTPSFRSQLIWRMVYGFCLLRIKNIFFFVYFRKEFQLAAYESENIKIYNFALSIMFDKLRHTTCE